MARSSSTPALLGVAVVLTTAILGSTPSYAVAPAKGRIVEGVGMAKVRLGMTERQVRARWRGPAKGNGCAEVTMVPGLRTCAWEIGKRGSGDLVRANFVEGRVAFLVTSTRRWKTRRGAAFAMPVNELATLYDGRVATILTGVPAACAVADLSGGVKATTFTFADATAAIEKGVDTIRVYDPAKVSWLGFAHGVVTPGRPQPGESPSCGQDVGPNGPPDVAAHGPYVGVKWVDNV